jgi:PHD/YefM family antitoxin component YafN of YafNO toxin-antitoxin module
VSEIHEPIYIKGRRNKAVIISEEDFRSMQETVFLLSIPGMRESLHEGMKEKTEECSDKLNW